MGILEEITPKATMLSAIEEYLESLDKKERAEWETVFADSHRYKPAQIVAALKRRCVIVNINAIYRYRTNKEAANG
jgi:hypothetical protein